MAQLVMAPAARAAASQLATGHPSARSARDPRSVVCSVSGGSMGGKRFEQRSNARRGRDRAKACWPQGFCGPQFGGMGPGVMGMGMGPAGMNMGATPDLTGLNDMFKDLEKWMGASARGTQDFEKWMGAGARGTAGNPLFMPVDIVQDADTYTFSADLPGVSKADTKVQANRDDMMLTISGSRAAPELSEDQQQRRRSSERKFGKFRRTFKLPEDADLSGISARFRDGVLTVVIKRTKPKEPETTDVPIDDWFDVSEGGGQA